MKKNASMIYSVSLKTMLLLLLLVFIFSCSDGGSGSDSTETTDASSPSSPSTPLVSSLSINLEKGTFVTNDLSSITATAAATFENDTSEDVTTVVSWSSSESSVATVNSSGTITPKGRGKSIITATVDNIKANGILEGYYSGEYSSKETPISIEATGPLTTYDGQVSSGINYYYINDLSSDNIWITISDLDYDADLAIYDNANFTGDPICKPFYGRNYREYCPFISDINNKVYFTVDGQYSTYGAGYTVTVQVVQRALVSDGGCSFPTNQGSAENPFEITDFYTTHAGKSDGTSYYTFSDIQENPVWIEISRISSDVTLKYYNNNSSFTALESQDSSTDSIVMAANLNSDTAYFSMTDNGDGACYGISLKKGEGTKQNPVNLYPEKNNVAMFGPTLTSSYYVFSVSAGSSYTTKIEGLSDGSSLSCDADLYIYDDDSSFTDDISCMGLPKDSTTDSESCTNTASSSLYYVKVANGSGCNENGSTFKLTVKSN